MNEHGVFSAARFLTNITLVARTFHVLCLNMIQKSLLLLGLIATYIAGVAARLAGGHIALSLLQGDVTTSHHNPCDSPWHN